MNINTSNPSKTNPSVEPPVDILTVADLVVFSQIIYNAMENTTNWQMIYEELSGLTGITQELFDKIVLEIKKIDSKTYTRNNCELYYLITLCPGEYPILGYGNTLIGTEKLQAGEVWKVGQTCTCKDTRYSKTFYYKGNGYKLTDQHLAYTIVDVGPQKQILILEKLMIYSYPLWSGHFLPKPPGNKIFR